MLVLVHRVPGAVASTEKARLLFEKMLGYANHLGLYSEQLGSSGEHLGNFPQAFTHLALISAATFLDRDSVGDRNRDVALTLIVAIRTSIGRMA